MSASNYENVKIATKFLLLRDTSNVLALVPWAELMYLVVRFQGAKESTTLSSLADVFTYECLKL